MTTSLEPELTAAGLPQDGCAGFVAEAGVAPVLALVVVLASRWLPAVPMPGSAWGALGIGLASATFPLAWSIHRRRRFPLERLPWVLAWCLGARFFFDGFLRWKALIAGTGFPWDGRLARLDAWLHGGPAHELLPSAPAFLRTLDAGYYLWFPVMTAGILCWAWNGRPAARRRFALAFVLTWILLGIMGGSLFASSGPIFAGFPVLAGSGTEAMRDALWSAYQAGAPTSISAMPSLHVAIPALYALSARGVLRWLLWGYAGLILVGSVALGWHWAIDGYAALLGVAAIWWLTGRVSRA